MTLITEAVDKVHERLGKKYDREVRELIEENDWEEHPVVDYVIVTPKPVQAPNYNGEKVFKVPVPTTQVVKHDTRSPPPVETSGVGGRRCEVYRIDEETANEI